MLANRTKSIVIAIDYRRPPEHPSPAALEDCLFVLDWINENQSSMTTSQELYLLGDSAGGQLVPALCIQNMSRENKVPVDGQILINPVLDMRTESVAYKGMPYFIKPYVKDESTLDDPLLSPLVYQDFDSFPPALVIVSETDPLKAEGLAFHEKMLEAGNVSASSEVKGAGHLGPMWAAGHTTAMPALEAAVAQLLKWQEK